MPSDRSIRLIDAFSGCGGMTLGFVRLSKGSFKSMWANDVNTYAADSYNANFGNHCQVGDIVEMLASPTTRIPPAEIVIGGPPCQGFSLLNRERKGDPRKRLWRPFLEIVRRAGAICFLMENVPQILGSPEYEAIVTESKAMGFRVASAKLCAADYGVPQTRYRAFLLGCNFANPNGFFPPRRTHYDPSNGHDPESTSSLYVKKPLPWITVRAAVGDLPPPEGTEIRKESGPLDLHFGRNPTAKSLARYRAIPEEGMNRFDLQERALELTPGCWIKKKTGGTDLFGRLWWNRPAFTIRTEFFKPEKGRYLHPEQHRPITHREAARFQSFPDDFAFKGTKIEMAKQIGNAVPPLLAARIADAVYEMFTRGA
ncbi:MAG: DNA cytosine methyltransferase [Desulfomonilaceae bacterium]|nr:DNA cytosine methyltransferase [Desulfomonilaceae bacterium]